MKRRAFLKTSAMATTSLMVPSFLPASLGGLLGGSRSGKILIVIQLSGGNDGLNTIVPYRNDVYYQNRPRLGLQPSEVLQVSDELGFNPGLEALRGLYDKGLLSIVNSVGYPNPDRSHFRSMDIWQTGSGSEANWSTGWLGRYLDSECEGCVNPYHALELDDSLSLALKGRERSGFAMGKPEQLRRTNDNAFLKAVVQASDSHGHEEQVSYLYKVMADTQASADYLYAQSKVYQSKVDFPQTPFGQDLKQVAELITADTATKVYYVSLTGFDTHVNQKSRQERLLKEYAEGVKALVEGLKQNNLFEDVLILTFSEFGRRVKQNASNGTDHGTANNVFLIGGSLARPGFFNAAPDLLDLDEGDLKYQADFRDIYATILGKWLEADAGGILQGTHNMLPFI
ncbi:MAG: DUF1501 domain-containing protein [Lewinellaceae bacterium]|nr:DUF1501 domain-containing protein [Lewinellaceae bacterium]